VQLSIGRRGSSTSCQLPRPNLDALSNHSERLPWAPYCLDEARRTKPHSVRACQYLVVASPQIFGIKQYEILRRITSSWCLGYAMLPVSSRRRQRILGEGPITLAIQISACINLIRIQALLALEKACSTSTTWTPMQGFPTSLWKLRSSWPL
jgi:hypothetical protein